MRPEPESRRGAARPALGWRLAGLLAPGGRPNLAVQAALITAVVLGYDAINGLAATRAATALRHGRDLLAREQRAHVSVEFLLNRALAPHRDIAVALNYFYDNAHFVVTLAALALLWLCRPQHYRRWRNALLGVNAIGLLVFWLYPVAPPRLLSAGFVDTVDAFHTWGSWHSGSLAHDANQYAAMPSLHVGWAVWTTLAVCALSRRRAVRVAAGGYLMLVVYVVLATANHYVADAVAGAAAALLAYAVAAALPGLWVKVVPLPARRRWDALIHWGQGRPVPDTEVDLREPRQPAAFPAARAPVDSAGRTHPDLVGVGTTAASSGRALGRGGGPSVGTTG